MVNNVSITGQLNNTDRIFDSGDIGAISAETRYDEYLLTADQPSSNLELTLAPTGGSGVAMVVANPANGNEVPGSFDVSGAGVPATANFGLIPGQNQYRVIVTTNDGSPSIPLDYKLDAEVSSGNVNIASLTQSIDETPDSGDPITLDGQLSEGDFLALPAVKDYSLADEYRVEPVVPGESLDAVLSSAVGFSPRLQIIDVTNGTITDNVLGVGTTASESLQAGREYRVRVFAQGKLGSEDVRDYELVLNAPSGVNVAQLDAGEGGGVNVVDSPTQQPAPPATAPDFAQYARFNKGEKGSVSGSGTGKPINNFNLIALSDGSDNINLASPPNVGGTPIFTDLIAGITGGSVNFDNARWMVALGGNDTINGTADNNIPVVGNKGNDTFNLGDGADVGVGGADDDTLNGEGGDDILNGNRGNDAVNGDDGADTLNGGADEDVLMGGFGDDVLSGDRGQDFLTGGGDADTFELQASNATATAAEADVITDFNASEADRVQLSGTSFAQVQLKATEIAVDAGSIQPATAIQDSSSGGYLGVLEGVSPYEVASIAETVFI